VLRGACSMATMTAFCGLLGSTSPEIVPSMRSFCPAGKLWAAKGGESTAGVVSCVPRALAGHTLKTATALVMARASRADHRPGGRTYGFMDFLLSRPRRVVSFDCRGCNAFGGLTGVA